MPRPRSRRPRCPRRHGPPRTTSSSGYLQALIRIPSINPPDPPGPELDVAEHLAAVLRAEGLRPEVIEPVARPRQRHRPAPRRRDRRRPAAAPVPSRRRPGPRGGRLDPRPVRRRDRGRLPLGSRRGRHEADGRDGAQVVLLLARRAREAGLDPASDPIPGLRRDVLFTCTSDEEAGGRRRRRAGSPSTGRRRSRRRAPSTSAAACRWSSPAGASTRSRSPRRASRSTGST